MMLNVFQCFLNFKSRILLKIVESIYVLKVPTVGNVLGVSKKSEFYSIILTFSRAVVLTNTVYFKTKTVIFLKEFFFFSSIQ